MLFRRRIATVLVLLFASAGFLFSQNKSGELEVAQLNFVYNGENMYVQNPIAADGIGFCITSVEINGWKDSSTIHSSGFEIALRDYNFHFNDSVHVKIFHHPQCHPRILNAEDFVCYSNMLKKIWVDTGGMLHFIPDSSFTMYGSNRFLIGQYRWKKCVVVGDAIPYAAKKQKEYQVDVRKYLYSDTNWFCVIIPMPDHGMKSQMVPCISHFKKPPVVFDSQSQRGKICFSAETQWELYDSNGTWRASGFGDTIDYSKFSEQNYFTLNYDNQTARIKVKENVLEKTNSPVILLYPNPAQNNFTLSTGEEFSGCALLLEICDLSGRVIVSRYVQGESATIVSVSDLSDGIYFVQLTHGNELICNRKMIVHH